MTEATPPTEHRPGSALDAEPEFIWLEGDEAEALEMVVSERLDDAELADSFTTEPLEAQVDRIRKSIGLGETAPPPEPSLPVEGGFFRRMFDGFRWR